MKIETKLIESLKPSQDMLDNWLQHYSEFNGSITEFLELEHIPATDKIWVAIRVLPRDIIEMFVIDCMFAVYAAVAVHANEPLYTNAVYAAYAVHAAAYATIAAADATIAADAATRAAAYAVHAAAYANIAADAATYPDYDAIAAAAARECQVDALIYLIEGIED